MRQPSKLTVLFDNSCSFCIQCMSWMQRQPSYFPVEFIGLKGEEARKRFSDILESYGAERFIAIADDADVYVGTNARIMCLYAMRDYRELSLRLSAPPLYQVADRLFEYTSGQRHFLSSMIKMDDTALKRLARRAPGATC